MLVFFVFPWSAAVWVSKGSTRRAGSGCCWNQDGQASLYPSYLGIKSNEKRIEGTIQPLDYFLFFHT